MNNSEDRYDVKYYVRDPLAKDGETLIEDSYSDKNTAHSMAIVASRSSKNPWNSASVWRNGSWIAEYQNGMLP